MFPRQGLPGILGLILTVGLVAFAQQPREQTPATPDSSVRQERWERKERRRDRMARHKGMNMRGGMGRLFRGLNLTDAQREQLRAITQRRLESTRSQREELFRLREKRLMGTFTPEDEARAKTLHQEIHTSMEGIGAEAEGILTTEQKAQLEQFKLEHKARHEERKARHEQRMKERQERLNKNQQ